MATSIFERRRIKASSSRKTLSQCHIEEGENFFGWNYCTDQFKKSVKIFFSLLFKVILHSLENSQKENIESKLGCFVANCSLKDACGRAINMNENSRLQNEYSCSNTFCPFLPKPTSEAGNQIRQQHTTANSFISFCTSFA